MKKQSLPSERTVAVEGLTEAEVNNLAFRVPHTGRTSTSIVTIERYAEALLAVVTMLPPRRGSTILFKLHVPEKIPALREKLR